MNVDNPIFEEADEHVCMNVCLFVCFVVCVCFADHLLATQFIECVYGGPKNGLNREVVKSRDQNSCYRCCL